MEELEPDGSVVVKNYLLEVSTPEVRYKFGQYIYKFVYYQVHARFHAPDQASMIVDDLILQMKKYIEANPMLPVGMI